MNHHPFDHPVTVYTPLTVYTPDGVPYCRSALATVYPSDGLLYPVHYWGHPRSSETSPFDRVHMTSYSILIETILYRFRIIASFSLKVNNFNQPHLHLSPP